MGQKKAHEVDGWLSKPDARSAIVLVYGPDRGLAVERAQRFAASTGLALDDPFSVIRIDASEIDATPGRLLDEANTFSMFGGRRLIWVRNAGAQKSLSDQVKDLASNPAAETLVLIEAGDLKKTAPLRTAVESAAAGMALPCFADETRALDGLIDEVLGADGLAIDRDARDALRRSLGGDRMASRRELEKLAVYSAGRRTVSLADVAACVGDVAASSAEDVVDAMLAGDMAQADVHLARLSFTGGSPQQVLGGALRLFGQMQGLRDSVETARVATAAAVAGARPPIFYARRGLVEAALAALDGQTLAAILRRLQTGVLDTRRRADLALSITRQTVLAIAAEVRRQRSGRR